jgi:hypothetical protein
MIGNHIVHCLNALGSVTRKQLFYEFVRIIHGAVKLSQLPDPFYTQCLIRIKFN